MSNVSRWNLPSAISSVSKNNWLILIKAKTIRLPFIHFSYSIQSNYVQIPQTLRTDETPIDPVALLFVHCLIFL